MKQHLNNLRRIVSAAVLATVAVATSAAAQTPVLTLGPGRAYEQQDLFRLSLTGESMSAARTALMQDGFIFVESESFRVPDLTGFRIVAMGLLAPDEELDGAEQLAIESYVRSGGALIYFGDNDAFASGNASTAGLFGVEYSTEPAAVSARDVLAPHHPVLAGPGGVVAEYDGSGNLTSYFGGIGSPGPYAQAVLRTPNRTVVAVIERNVIQPGSGPVVLVSDINGFLDPGIGTIDLANNLALLRNIFAFARGTCTNDASCSDGAFCNGEERCVGGTCVPGTPPCAAGGNPCNEAADSCATCVNDGQCDDGLFCNGTERCSAGGVCESGAPACGDSCEHCRESDGTCRWCIFDLDVDGSVAAGDAQLLSTCMGACFAPTDACAAANFDSDTANCVGSADFAAFSACFGLMCAECPTCSGPPSAPRVAASASKTGDRVLLSVTTRPRPTPADLVGQLPESQLNWRRGDTLFAEIWVSSRAVPTAGVAAAYVDVTWDPENVQLLESRVSESLATLSRPGVLHSGLLEGVGGCAAPGRRDVGQAGRWVKVAAVRMQVMSDGMSQIGASLPGGPLGVSLLGEYRNVTEGEANSTRALLKSGNGKWNEEGPSHTRQKSPVR